MPYRDFFENKTPLSFLMGAMAYRAGQALGVEPLLAIRAGELALVALSGLLVFAIVRRLHGGSAAAGAFALLAWCGFPLLGAYAAVGVLPKLRMAVLAWTAMLCVDGGWWIGAGLAAGLAALDWQVGGLVLLAVGAGALQAGAGRGARLARVGVGVAAVGLLALGVLAHAGALRAAWAQAVATLLGAGGASAEVGLLRRAARIGASIRFGCEGHLWLVAIAVAGLACFPFRLRRLRRRGRAPLAVALGVYAYGLIAFSLVDFQGYGDLYPVAHVLALFAGIALSGAFRWLSAAGLRRAARQGRPWSRGIATATALLALALLTRPLLQGDFTPADRPAAAHPGATLEDQRQVMRQVLAQVDPARTAFVGTAEILFLAERENAVPFVYWNGVTYRHYRNPRSEGSSHALRRMLTGRGVDTLVFGAPAPRPIARPGDRVVSSADGTYGVTVRRVLPPPGRDAEDAAEGRREDEIR